MLDILKEINNITEVIKKANTVRVSKFFVKKADPQKDVGYVRLDIPEEELKRYNKEFVDWFKKSAVKYLNSGLKKLITSNKTNGMKFPDEISSRISGGRWNDYRSFEELPSEIKSKMMGGPGKVDGSSGKERLTYPVDKVDFVRSLVSKLNKIYTGDFLKRLSDDGESKEILDKLKKQYKEDAEKYDWEATEADLRKMSEEWYKENLNSTTGKKGRAGLEDIFQECWERFLSEILKETGSKGGKGYFTGLVEAYSDYLTKSGKTTKVFNYPSIQQYYKNRYGSGDKDGWAWRILDIIREKFALKRKHSLSGIAPRKKKVMGDGINPESHYTHTVSPDESDSKLHQYSPFDSAFSSGGRRVEERGSYPKQKALDPAEQFINNSDRLADLVEKLKQEARDIPGSEGKEIKEDIKKLTLKEKVESLDLVKILEAMLAIRGIDVAGTSDDVERLIKLYLSTAPSESEDDEYTKDYDPSNEKTLNRGQKVLSEYFRTNRDSWNNMLMWFLGLWDPQKIDQAYSIVKKTVIELKNLRKKLIRGNKSSEVDSMISSKMAEFLDKIGPKLWIDETAEGDPESAKSAKSDPRYKKRLAIAEDIFNDIKKAVKNDKLLEVKKILGKIREKLRKDVEEMNQADISGAAGLDPRKKELQQELSVSKELAEESMHVSKPRQFRNEINVIVNRVIKSVKEFEAAAGANKQNLTIDDLKAHAKSVMSSLIDRESKGWVEKGKSLPGRFHNPGEDPNFSQDYADALKEAKKLLVKAVFSDGKTREDYITKACQELAGTKVSTERKRMVRKPEDVESLEGRGHKVQRGRNVCDVCGESRHVTEDSKEGSLCNRCMSIVEGMDRLGYKPKSKNGAVLLEKCRKCTGDDPRIVTEPLCKGHKGIASPKGYCTHGLLCLTHLSEVLQEYAKANEEIKKEKEREKARTSSLVDKYRIYYKLVK